MKNKEKLVGTLSDDSDDNAVKVEDTKLVIKKKFLSEKKRKRPSSDEYENPGFYAALDQGIEIRKLRNILFKKTQIKASKIRGGFSFVYPNHRKNPN